MVGTTMKIRVKKVDGVIVGFDPEAVEAMKKFPVNELLELNITRPRNSGHHRKFFAMLNIIVQNYHEQITVNDLLTHVKSELNYWDVFMVGNSHHKRYKSIAFANMDQDQFTEFYNKAVNVCLALVPMSRDDLANQIARF
jgi:uncharacterized SAM-dependent methyltransferase